MSSSDSGRVSMDTMDSHPEMRLSSITVDDILIKKEGDTYHTADTFSVTSSVMDYRYENGRSYHRYRDGVYLLPNDEAEKDRLDVVHHIMGITLGGEFFRAPVKDPKNILDIGTGTGIWAIHAADMFPEANVIGTDLSPIQPENVPPNCAFEIDDCESEWTWPKEHFDFIHSRHLSQSIRDWDRYLSQMYQHTKPGGWVELNEHDYGLFSDDGTYTPALALYQLLEVLKELQEKAGLVDVGPMLGRMARNAGFVDVRVEVYKIPWGPWAKDAKLKELGHWTLLTLTSTAFEAFGMALLTRYNKMTPLEAKDLCERASRDVWNKHVHTYNRHFIVIARKPESAAATATASA